LDTVCFLALTMPDWQEMFAMAKYLREQTVAWPVMLLPTSNLSHVLQETKDAGIEAVELIENSDADNQIEEHPAWRAAILKLAEKISYQIPSKRLALFWESRVRVRRLQRQYDILKRIVGKRRPGSVIVRNGRNLNWEQALLRICHENHIPTLIQPISYSGDYRDLLRRRSASTFVADRFPRLRAKFPDQRVWDPNRQANIFFFGAAETMALAECSMLPPNPWIPGGGHQTLLMCESIESKERYLELGVRAQKIVVTGHPAHDEIFKSLQKKEELKRKLTSKYGLVPDKPLVLVTIPPLYEQGSHEQQPANDEIESLCDQLRRLQGNCLILLHPKMPFQRYHFIQDKYGLPIAAERLQSIIAAGDIFLASFSSTINYAVLCGIPTLIFAFHGFRFNMFDHLKGVHILDHIEELVPEVNRLITDNEYYESLARHQRRSLEHLSIFDGGCKARMTDIILRCMAGDAITSNALPNDLS